MQIGNILDDDEIIFIENRFHLPTGFLAEINSESDWGYIIKSHALFEALITQLLVETLGRPEIKDHLYRLPMNGKASKISFLVALCEIESADKKETQTFIQELSELRNYIVHHAENLNFDLKTYYSKLNRECDKNKYKKKLCFFAYDIFEEVEKDTDYSLEKFFVEQTRMCLKATVDMMLKRFSYYVENATIKNALLEKKLKLVENISKLMIDA